MVNIIMDEVNMMMAEVSVAVEVNKMMGVVK